MTRGRIEIARGMPEYPILLAGIPDPPPCLFCMGNVGLLRAGLGIIGARRATPYGRSAASLFSRWTARHGLPVISGAAIGCDEEAHRGALSVGGPTIAVLGCGADVDYPRGSRRLLEQIRCEGLVVSEQPWGTEPRKWMFPRRNRLIAGLSKAVLVVEATLPSGTFSTVDHALAYGREVLAVPGSIHAPESRGPNRLIRQGAAPILDVSDLAFELGLTTDEAEDLAQAPVEDPLLRMLLADPTRPDDAARELGESVVAIARRLGALERDGFVARYPDGRYGPCATTQRTIQSRSESARRHR